MNRSSSGLIWPLLGYKVWPLFVCILFGTFQSVSHCKDTIPNIWNKYLQERNCAAVPIPTFMFLWAIYLFLWSVCLFCGRKIGGLNLGIYRSPTDTWMWKLGHKSFSGNMFIPIFLQCGLHRNKFSNMWSEKTCTGYNWIQIPVVLDRWDSWSTVMGKKGRSADLPRKLIRLRLFSAHYPVRPALYAFQRINII